MISATTIQSTARELLRAGAAGDGAGVRVEGGGVAERGCAEEGCGVSDATGVC
jgi:hypothetical protein